MSTPSPKFLVDLIQARMQSNGVAFTAGQWSTFEKAKAGKPLSQVEIGSLLSLVRPKEPK